MNYICPMHPEIEREKEGNCPKCGMRLVKKGTKALIHTQSSLANVVGKYIQKLGDGYQPLIIIFSTIFFISLLITIFIIPFSFRTLISNFMIGFFLVFSAFKLLDIKGFAQGYATYDLLAKQWYGYGYLYPLIELFFGIAMIIAPFDQNILKFEIVIMTFSGIGVLLKILKHAKFQCSCLGTFLKVPLTKVTLIEDFGMAILAIFLLIF